ncbi:hypothetical protein E2C01_001036 [Portunus trituberculatus]|uniref:Uncharacterized protein n=1 Tax=Portunus trituberculatus TaxID=210409 RepID=A0A5B7CFW6_PORTR|nr:hypothetical protein [Portunus trituberculatus]
MTVFPPAVGPSDSREARYWSLRHRPKIFMTKCWRGRGRPFLSFLTRFFSVRARSGAAIVSKPGKNECLDITLPSNLPSSSYSRTSSPSPPQDPRWEEESKHWRNCLFFRSLFYGRGNFCVRVFLQLDRGRESSAGRCHSQEASLYPANQVVTCLPGVRPRGYLSRRETHQSGSRVTAVLMAKYERDA